MPASVAMSSKPPRPKKVLTLTRMKVSALFCSLSWATLLTKLQTSPRLPKKLPTPVRTIEGSTRW